MVSILKIGLVDIKILMNLYNNHNLMLCIVKNILNGYLLKILKILLILPEIKTHLQIYLWDIVQCYGITQDQNTKDYMMVLEYCREGNLRNYYLNNESDYYSKINKLQQIVSGLLDNHNAGKVHKDFHSGNILHRDYPLISDLGMCQPANNEKQSVKQEGIYGVLPYMALEVLRGYQYTKVSDIYSFGIMMNEFISEETPYNNIPHNHALSIKICKGLRPNIFKYTPKLLADLITKCWDAKAENSPTTKELYQTLNKWDECRASEDSDTGFQIYEYNDKIKLNRTNSECFDCQLDELDLDEINQEEENNNTE
ncbi:kinase-like domain-containing protein [Rhizophagus irregularis DAOM 181602=DAOM 197198]|uniref:Kinase-like domain-containing protein n=1 Tax=Rhizophagus irregularis (strain DAOM 181602 / DAOM 197198 / MUCL 43194) TaxID=747089 RepID=A0A2P4QI01_RHIID|nr:kinase-like domain-containing protein [Rhizophagus irregularis DAOM 181602=DAOM 197198]POG77262.1 kinase-like domain-containing protein [Rhizophagus irregularis DAOM 181602=DAOM 197198]|eukprot:XP_025184128.1 kinase-like domain-containing protein [Rhizophagus irregularis DAOM 181602=DAOM 197198]